MQDASEDILMSQALVVVAGPHTGRICYNDDNEFVLRSDFSSWEAKAYEKAGVKWRPLNRDSRAKRPRNMGVDCEIVTFGHYLMSRGTYSIPRQCLLPATMKDLVTRHSEISNEVMRWAFDVDETDDAEAAALLTESLFIQDEVWRRESEALGRSAGASKKVFLCHASVDKPFVRQVMNDLAGAGHSAWIDEFEIKVGDSIVDKINDATASADAFALFLSKASTSSSWVKREWQSTLKRFIEQNNLRLLPVLIEDCKIPSLIGDLRYADFRESYRDGLTSLLRALA